VSAEDDAVSRATEPTYTDAPDKGDWHDRRHAPFAEGNEASMKNGSRSKRVMERATKIISDDLLERYPHVCAFPEAVEALGRATAMARLTFAAATTGGVSHPDGTLKASEISKWATAENVASRLRTSLGMTPESEASVARDRAAAVSMAAGVDLEALANRGREALDARTAQTHEIEEN
jgi:hypothetical protein